MKPTDPLRENCIPIYVTWLQLTHSRVTSVRTTHSTSDTIPSFGEVQTISATSAQSIIWNPFHPPCVHSSLQNEILCQSSNWIVCKSCGHCCSQSKTSAQSTCNIVLTSTFPDVEGASCVDPPLPWVHAEHHFTQAQFIENAIRCRFQHQRHGDLKRVACQGTWLNLSLGGSMRSIT